MTASRTVHTKRLNETYKRELQVYYDKGGVNYWDYSQKPKGIYFASTVYEQAEGATSRTWTTGQKGDGYILVVPLERYSAKQLRLVRERVEEHADQIHTLFNTGNHLEQLKQILAGEYILPLAA